MEELNKVWVRFNKEGIKNMLLHITVTSNFMAASRQWRHDDTKYDMKAATIITLQTAQVKRNPVLVPGLSDPRDRRDDLGDSGPSGTESDRTGLLARDYEHK